MPLTGASAVKAPMAKATAAAKPPRKTRATPQPWICLRRLRRALSLIWRSISRVARLLRKPGGFEGFLPLLVHAHAFNGPVADRDGPGGTGLYLDPIASLRAKRPRHHYVVTRLNELVRLDARRLPDAAKL